MTEFRAKNVKPTYGLNSVDIANMLRDSGRMVTPNNDILHEISHIVHRANKSGGADDVAQWLTIMRNALTVICEQYEVVD